MVMPQNIIDMAEFSPVEDVMVPILRAGLPGIQVDSLIEHGQTFPFMLVRRSDTFGMFRGDHRFVDSAQVVIHAYAEDPNGDEDAALLCEAGRIAIRDAWLKQTVVPERGHITSFEMLSVPHRVTDWATSTGPVQYADLPTGVHRYEARFALAIKRPRRLAVSIP